MALQYFKRFRMEFDLEQWRAPAAALPEDYVWVAWQPVLIERHAQVKCESFRHEVDAQVFPCLGDFQGCARLMREIAHQPGFLPQATWLLRYRGDDHSRPMDCGTIQGLAHSELLGAVQNVGVVPEHRGMGLGRALILQALAGFRGARLRKVYLEVTATNYPAVELYRSVGFRLIRTMYRAVQLEEAQPV